MGRFQGAVLHPAGGRYGRVCQILVYKDGRGGVTCRWDWPHLLEVASELGNELRWILGGDDAPRSSPSILSSSS